MRRLPPFAELRWLAERPAGEAATGYAPEGWEAQVWILHAMYESKSTGDRGTHDDDHRRRLVAGEIAPVIVNGVNLDDMTTVSGIPLGYVGGVPSRRIRWSEYVERFRDFAQDRSVPPCYRWFPPGSWPASVMPPPEGSLDEESLSALLRVLSSEAAEGSSTACYAFYASLAAGDFDHPHLWHVPLGDIPSLLSVNGGPYDSSPTNVWSCDRSWFVWTDWDLQGTRVSGSRRLIESMKATAELETVVWTPP
jgi:hypothetical protein